MTRVDPPLAGDESSTLLGFLAYHRETFRMKCAGLTPPQLAVAHPPSVMTLGGLMKHLALVESSWFSEDFLGEPMIDPFNDVDWDADRDWEWHTAAEDSPAELLALFDQACTASDAIIAGAPGLDALSVVRDKRTGELFSLRWMVVHMIEEYARHNGHADLIRESIDGSVGE